MIINIIFPFFPSKPGGGLRVLFEYANHLAKLDHNVKIYYQSNTAFFNDRLGFPKYIYRKYVEKAKVTWFNVDKNISQSIVWKVNNENIDDGDVIFSTWYALVYDIKTLDSGRKGIHFNLVQDIEDWFGNGDAVKNSYSVANAVNVVIAQYLYDYIKQITRTAPEKLSFSIDKHKYKISTPIKDRHQKTICMMYSNEPRKGSVFGIEALRILKLKHSDLRATFFGVDPRPSDLPEWIEYFQKYPDIPSIYNGSAIFIGPSRQEGCALPPMEAMYCGCAVVCTDIEGHRDYAFNIDTALLSLPNDSKDLASKIDTLLENNEQRIQLATRGYDYMSQYSWERSTKELEQIFINKLTALRASV